MEEMEKEWSAHTTPYNAGRTGKAGTIQPITFPASVWQQMETAIKSSEKGMKIKKEYTILREQVRQ